jgi:hypothetical protein
MPTVVCCMLLPEPTPGRTQLIARASVACSSPRSPNATAKLSFGLAFGAKTQVIIVELALFSLAAPPPPPCCVWSEKGIKLGQLLGQLDIFLTWVLDDTTAMAETALLPSSWTTMAC